MSYTVAALAAMTRTTVISPAIACACYPGYAPVLRTRRSSSGDPSPPNGDSEFLHVLQESFAKRVSSHENSLKQEFHLASVWQTGE